MTAKSFTGKGGETWEWDGTPEVVEAIKQLHISARNRRLVKPHPYHTNEQKTTNS